MKKAPAFSAWKTTREPGTSHRGRIGKGIKPTPKIVILSACHSARPEPDLMPAARALFEAGIETVIGMKKRVSHLAAIEFNAAFFNALCRKKTVKQAFEIGKQAILIGEQRRIKEIPGWDAVNEYEIPQLLAKDENLTVENFSEHRIEAPGRPESHHFLGARYWNGDLLAGARSCGIFSRASGINQGQWF